MRRFYTLCRIIKAQGHISNGMAAFFIIIIGACLAPALAQGTNLPSASADQQVKSAYQPGPMLDAFWPDAGQKQISAGINFDPGSAFVPQGFMDMAQKSGLMFVQPTQTKPTLAGLMLEEAAKHSTATFDASQTRIAAAMLQIDGSREIPAGAMLDMMKITQAPATLPHGTEAGADRPYTHLVTANPQASGGNILVQSYPGQLPGTMDAYLGQNLQETIGHLPASNNKDLLQSAWSATQIAVKGDNPTDSQFQADAAVILATSAAKNLKASGQTADYQKAMVVVVEAKNANLLVLQGQNKINEGKNLLLSMEADAKASGNTVLERAVYRAETNWLAAISGVSNHQVLPMQEGDISYWSEQRMSGQLTQAQFEMKMQTRKDALDIAAGTGYRPPDQGTVSFYAGELESKAHDPKAYAQMEIDIKRRFESLKIMQTGNSSSTKAGGEAASRNAGIFRTLAITTGTEQLLKGYGVDLKKIDRQALTIQSAKETEAVDPKAQLPAAYPAWQKAVAQKQAVINQAAETYGLLKADSPLKQADLDAILGALPQGSAAVYRVDTDLILANFARYREVLDAAEAVSYKINTKEELYSAAIDMKAVEAQADTTGNPALIPQEKVRLQQNFILRQDVRRKADQFNLINNDMIKMSWEDVKYWADRLQSKELSGPRMETKFATRLEVINLASQVGFQIPTQGDVSFWAEKLEPVWRQGQAETKVINDLKTEFKVRVDILAEAKTAGYVVKSQGELTGLAEQIQHGQDVKQVIKKAINETAPASDAKLETN